MNECFADWFLVNNVVVSKEEFYLPNNFEFLIYEVIRVIDGIPLFLEDHLERLSESFKLKVSEKLIDDKQITKELKSLIKINKINIGNIKYAVFFNKSQVKRFAYFIKHSYPSDAMYKNGVKLVSLEARRPLPNAKILHQSLRFEVDKLLLNKDIYEVVLIDNQHILTEGSRSNVFFIKNNCLYTAPDNLVLKGITRKYVLELAKKENIMVHQTSIKYSNLKDFDCAFLCGTSPKILPICEIDSVKFNTLNNQMTLLTNKYNEFIDHYISIRKLKSE